MDTLVLNTDMQPLSVLPLSRNTWQEAVKAMWAGNVTVIAEYESWVVRSPSVEIKVPSIVMVNKYISMNKDVKFSRNNLFLRDDYTCQYCLIKPGKANLTFEHVQPRWNGGKTTWENIVCACEKCNSKKGPRLDYIKPKSKPIKPTYWQLAAKQRKKPIIIPDKAWLDFISWDGDVSFCQQPKKIINLIK